ncbi:MAG: hypothetical protein ACRDZ8_15015 [Acidimicrobiales bacterium]
MSVHDGAEPVDPLVLEIINELGALSGRDQELVLALIARLRQIPLLAEDDIPPDVPFMNFDE